MPPQLLALSLQTGGGVVVVVAGASVATRKNLYQNYYGGKEVDF